MRCAHSCSGVRGIGIFAHPPFFHAIVSTSRGHRRRAPIDLKTCAILKSRITADGAYARALTLLILPSARLRAAVCTDRTPICSLHCCLLRNRVSISLGFISIYICAQDLLNHKIELLPLPWLIRMPGVRIGAASITLNFRINDHGAFLEFSIRLLMVKPDDFL